MGGGLANPGTRDHREGPSRLSLSFRLEGTRQRTRACHCIELPFLLGSQEAWRAAPALAGADWAEIEFIGKRMRKIWADFARGGHTDTAWSTDAVKVLPDKG